MFKHILIPVDGSDFSDRAVDTGVRFAKSLNARITGFIAEPEYKLPTHGEIVSRTAVSMYEHEDKARKHAEGVLKRIAERAKAEGVQYDSGFVASDQPADAIVEAAEQHHCDLILMVSHARRGLDKLLHGSVAGTVMARTRVPVLVLH